MKVLNLFLALLLSSFGAESLSQTSPDEAAEPNKLQEAVDRINRFSLYVKSHVSYAFKRKLCRVLHQRPAAMPGSTGSLPCGRDWQASNGQVREIGVYLVSDHDVNDTCPHQHTAIGLYTSEMSLFVCILLHNHTVSEQHFVGELMQCLNYAARHYSEETKKNKLHGICFGYRLTREKA